MGIGFEGTFAIMSTEGGAGEDVGEGLRRRKRTMRMITAISPFRALGVNGMTFNRRRYYRLVGREGPQEVDKAQKFSEHEDRVTFNAR